MQLLFLRARRRSCFHLVLFTFILIRFFRTSIRSCATFGPHAVSLVKFCKCGCILISLRFGRRKQFLFLDCQRLSAHRRFSFHLSLSQKAFGVLLAFPGLLGQSNNLLLLELYLLFEFLDFSRLFSSFLLGGRDILLLRSGLLFGFLRVGIRSACCRHAFLHLSFQDIPTSLPLCFQGFPTSLPFRRGGPLGAVGIGFCGFPLSW
mmetsp:Transcript_40041/g.81879  ORF Transcript_40041/g.81879 Transcript_40041/m.81879 type:complete len:205 (+) Transcript_40041:419-1033(+)